jgi:hypothetical protein
MKEKELSLVLALRRFIRLCNLESWFPSPSKENNLAHCRLKTDTRFKSVSSVYCLLLTM